ncbi:hypothetical protein CLOSYM_02006 [[Clostridium] symbiosum ATCC 14940]|uniref:Uncharacterized protein n=1 Tax=[Clostridium] symbiosum ATCC 14940 TaxID=411472 RepID=A0ABC9TYJ4_CLOSY|nr:hypothetical protein CLOSYM_02006 [[Clostridium] symbiosum ATCC 14940]
MRLQKSAEDLISACRKHVVAAPGPAAIHSGRIPPHDHLQPGTEDSAIPLTTPDMARSGRVLHSQSNLISKSSQTP